MEELKIGDRTYKIKELLYKDIVELGDVDKKESAKKMLFLATDITDDEYEKLTVKDGISLQKKVNEVNQLDELGFQESQNQKKE